jgi:hypothetical protein
MSNIIPGSLAAIAAQEGQSLAESFLSADAIVLVDVSGSMGARDVDGPPLRASWDEGIHATSGRTRYEAACDELTKLQATLPGKIAVVAFSTTPAFCWSGRPRFECGGTDMAAALRFIQPADGCGMTLILISDGYPDNADETLRIARQFASPITTIYIGPKGERGEEFLRKLAAATGGQTSVNSVPELSAKIAGLLEARAA